MFRGPDESDRIVSPGEVAGHRAGIGTGRDRGVRNGS